MPIEVFFARVDRVVARAAGAELRRLRLRAGLSQDDVARALGSFREVVSRTERGVCVPRLGTCARFASICGGGLGHVLLAVDRATGALPSAGG